MKKRKLLRNVSLVALSAVLVGGTAMAFTACGGGTSPDELRVYIFCGTADLETNQAIVDAAMAKFNADHPDLGRTVTARVTNTADRNDYFTELERQLNNNGASDVFYMAPKYARSYASNGYVLDLTPYLTGQTAGMSENAAANAEDIWGDALALYGVYNSGSGYQNASEAVFDSEANAWVDGENKLGIYGLPKDYSSFSMGYNRNFFTDKLKEAYTTTYANTGRTVTAHKFSQGSSVNGVVHEGGSALDEAITYAVNGRYTNPYANNGQGAEVVARVNQPAPIINIGVPTRYRPFNFYKYASYSAALAGGDPIALSVEAYTNGEGYVVTIPGFPDETFTVPEAYRDAKAPYDTTMGHITYTYAEYGALIWAVTYYLNTFAWDNNQSNPLSGQGGRYITVVGDDGDSSSYYQNVYGGEQYDHSTNDYFGVNGYLLPWLTSNDALITTTDSTRAWNTTDEPESFAGTTKDIKSYVGTDSETITKLNLDGTTREAEVQYGFDSENFIETYGAFHEIATTWNGNSGTTGDAGTADDRGSLSGWDYFTLGASIFYGAGTWDASTRNESNTSDFWFGQMPVPVSEKLALYSQVRNGYYEIATYSNAETDKVNGKDAGADVGNASEMTGDYAQRGTISDASSQQAGLKIYNQEAIERNQLKRQDKWGARMDSVGYAVNAAVTEYSGDEEWKEEAAVYVVEYLTIDRDSQVSLTYGGAQMPNFVDQCEDFLKYNDAQYNEQLAAAGRENAFADMITPDGDAEGNPVWNVYYEQAVALSVAARNRSTNTQTVAEYMQGKTVTYTDKNGQSVTEAVKYNESYASTRLADFAGDPNSLLAYSMRVLNLVNFSKKDRDLNMRMEYGLNSTRDQLMYTRSTNWLQPFCNSADASTSSKLMAYLEQASVMSKGAPVTSGVAFRDMVATNPQDAASKTYWTPAINAVMCARESQRLLNSTMNVNISAGDGPYNG